MSIYDQDLDLVFPDACSDRPVPSISFEKEKLIKKEAIAKCLKNSLNLQLRMVKKKESGIIIKKIAKNEGQRQ